MISLQEWGINESIIHNVWIMQVVLTGAAGFIGFHTAQALLKAGYSVVGVDNLNTYYDVSLKENRLAYLQKLPGFTFLRLDVGQLSTVDKLKQMAPQAQYIVHLAAQAGVRYSLENPYTYIDSNVMGQTVMLEYAKTLKNLKKFVFASTSSVYGTNDKLPFSVTDRTDTPMAVYAATKKCGELLGHVYAHLYKLPVTCLRFFTVYGPWGRPDMAAFLFTKAILANQPIRVFNHGDMRRNFTYVADVVQGIMGALQAQTPSFFNNNAPFSLYNIGNSKSESLMDFIRILENNLGKEAIKKMEPIQQGDVKETIADIESSITDLGFSPQTNLEEGLKNFVDWYKDYYHVA